MKYKSVLEKRYKLSTTVEKIFYYIKMASGALSGLPGGQVEGSNTRDLNSRKRHPQLKFAQAITHCEAMFPDMDEEAIEAILRYNKGAVDATMSNLWTMSAHYEYDRLLHDPTDGEISRTGKEHHLPDCSGNPALYQQARKSIQA